MILQYIVRGSSEFPVAVSLGVKRIMGHRPVAAAGVRTWDLFVAGGELATWWYENPNCNLFRLY